MRDLKTGDIETGEKASKKVSTSKLKIPKTNENTQ